MTKEKLGRPLGKEVQQARVAQSYLRLVLRQLARNRGAMAGCGVLLILIVLALAGPWVAPYDYAEAAGGSLEPPGNEHWMGTDLYGRDIFSRVIYGTRYSLAVGLVAVGIGMTFGLVLGLAAGYYGGLIDRIAVMAIDAMLALPGILLAMAIIAVLGPGILKVMIAVGVASIPRYARLVRASVLTTREETYVESARAVGVSNIRVIGRHVLPNVIGPVFVYATLNMPTAVLSAAGLSFLGLGAQPPTPEWGLMVSEGRKLLQVAWWISTFPGLAIMFTVLGLNLLGDGLRDAIDPRLRD